MSSKPDIFVCLGYAKSGTTWLHDYFEGHPQAHMRQHKEIYFFGHRDEGVSKRVKLRNDAIKRQCLRSLRGMPNENGRAFETLRDLYEWDEYLGDPETAEKLYPSYLQLRSELKDDVRVCGDITPGYATLSTPCLKRMTCTVPDAKYLLLLRDPVSRLWSHCKYVIRQDTRRERQTKNRQVANSLAQVSANEVMERFIENDSNVRQRLMPHCDYAGFLERFLPLIERDQLFIGFHEHLTTREQIGGMCDFLGIDFLAPDAERRLNPGGKQEIPDGLKKKAMSLLEENYSTIREKLKLTLPDKWNESLALETLG